MLEQRRPHALLMVLITLQGAWDIGSPLLPEAVSQQWYHSAAAWLSALPFAPLQQLYMHAL
jgi:hypothetical protein